MLAGRRRDEVSTASGCFRHDSHLRTLLFFNLRQVLIALRIRPGFRDSLPHRSRYRWLCRKKIKV
jgi:hypothetical protein